METHLVWRERTAWGDIQEVVGLIFYLLFNQLSLVQSECIQLLVSSVQETPLLENEVVGDIPMFAIVNDNCESDVLLLKPYLILALFKSRNVHIIDSKGAVFILDQLSVGVHVLDYS